MAKLRLVTAPKPNSKVATHRASATEGEAAYKLLENQGFTIRGPKNKQYELRCPFHEGPGSLEPRKSPNFYMNAETSVYFCQSASCGEKGNLQTLERFFGIDFDDDAWKVQFRDRESRLKEYELNLTKALRQPFYDHGLTDTTIERFRLGYWPEHTNDAGRTVPGRYVIPYLENRRPKFFRFYSPDGDPRFKYTWEDGAEGTLFNPGDAMGDPQFGISVLCEGEQKAMLLTQMGYAAVAVPGASQWKDEYQAAFTHAKRIVVCYDNDNPEHPSNNYDKPDRKCVKCSGRGLPACIGHNPGQEAALKRVEQLGWRAKNVVLPLPDEDTKKTDVNEYFVRDNHSGTDFAELATGKRQTPFKVLSLGEIIANPPEDTEFIIEDGILSRGGRLLIAGKPKVGKSILVNNLALSLSSGKRFLSAGSFKGFTVESPTRTLLLDRELSKNSLLKRLQGLIADKPGYAAAEENLLIDHDHLIRLDQPNAYETLIQLIEQNGAEVCILDTAYKFFGDVEGSSSLKKGFDVLDKIIHETGCSFVLTHHIKKSQGSSGGRQAADYADPDNVAGSFLWTGWPNATILINFLNRSVENPFNAVATFTAFRDAAPPEPVILHRDRTSISYTAIETFSHEQSNDDTGGGYYPGKKQVIKPTTDLVSNLLLECCPVTEEDFLHMAAGKFGVSLPTIKPYFFDAMSRGDFERTSGKPPIIKFKYEPEPEQTWEAEHNLPERRLPDGATVDDVELFEAASELV